MEYFELQCKVSSLSAEEKDILTAFLSDVGFESFTEDETAFKAYIQSDTISPSQLKQVMSELIPIIGNIDFTFSPIASQDWNQGWEASFQYAEVCDDIIVKVSNYQPTKYYPYSIIIQPQNAFGSGTHETTSLILQTLLNQDVKDKIVADCGCGTGILGIFAFLIGAKSVFAFDYDAFSVENTRLNAQLNLVTNITVKQASLDCLQDKKFDIVLANINRNILTNNMKYLAQSIEKQGIIIMSGFYLEDVTAIQQSAESYGLTLLKTESKNNWTITTFIRK